MHKTAGETFAGLRHSLASLASAGVIPQVTPELAATMASAGSALREAVLAEIPAFAASGNPAIMPGLEQHASEHMQEIMRLLAGGDVGEFAFVVTHAHRRAEQHFPLETTLHAYRCGHRVVSHWLRNAAAAVGVPNLERAISAVADFSIEYTDVISSIAASEYVAQARLLAEAEGDRRSELLNILLSGFDEADGRVARLLKRAGYLEQRQAYCVAVVQAANAGEMENPSRAQRIVTALTDAMAGHSIRTLAGTRNSHVTAVFSDRRRQSGWTAPQSNLADRIAPILQVLGPSILVGISSDHPSTSFVPKALHEAQIALDFATTANRVVQFAGLPIRDLLVHRGADYVQSVLPGWIAALAEANRKSDGSLVQTLRAIADANMNVQQAARAIGKHPNTVYARLERINTLTGRDAQCFHDLTELLLAADCWRLN